MMSTTANSTCGSVMPVTPLVSIIVNNYNYGRFIRSAINSALAQSYPAVEVVVVDDGSSDGSQAVISTYGERIVPLFKANEGQASAFNAGFAHSRGEIIIFLDADDLLLPHVAGQVVQAFQAEPQAARVVYRMAVVDADGELTGEYAPALYLPLPVGNLTRKVLRFPDDIPYPATSGNAFARRVLAEILPIPEHVYGQTNADLYLHSLTPLCGPLVALAEVGARYRVHGNNQHYDQKLNLERIRGIIERSLHNHCFIGRLAAQKGLCGFPANPVDVLAVTFIANRLVSLKLAPAEHPICGDRLAPVLSQGMRAALGRFDLSLVMRIVYMLWFLAMVIAPPSFAHRLATWFFIPESRSSFNRLLGPLRW